MAGDNALFDYIRDLEASGVDNANWELITLFDDVVIASGTTAPDSIPNTPLSGKLAVDASTLGYPGPFLYRVTDPLTGITREHTSKSIGQVGAIRMSDLPFAFAMMLDGVIGDLQGELQVSGTGTTPAAVTIAAGAAFGHGLIYRWPVQRTLTIAPGGAKDRIDLVVLRFYLPGNEQEGKVELIVRQGVEADSPVVLPPIQDDVTLLRWDVALAQIAVGAGLNTIAPNKVTDRRAFTSGPRLDARYLRKEVADTKQGALTIVGPPDSGGIFNVREDTVIRFYLETGTPAIQLRNGTDFLMYSGNKSGLLFRLDGYNGQMDFGGIGKPTISIHSSLGGSGSSVDVHWGNDNVFQLRITGGNAPSAGNILAVIFNKNRQSSTYQVTFSPSNGPACDVACYATGLTQDHFDVTTRQAMQKNVEYWYSCQVVGAL